MMAGRSPWLCQGTMPPGSMVSLRNRSWRSLMFAGSFSRSMAASTVSVTPLPAWATGARASAFILSEGQLPATAADTPASIDPAVMPARTTFRATCQLPVMEWNMIMISSIGYWVFLPGGRPQRHHHQSNARRTEMPNNSRIDTLRLLPRYFGFTLEVMELITLDAILN